MWFVTSPGRLGYLGDVWWSLEGALGGFAAVGSLLEASWVVLEESWRRLDGILDKQNVAECEDIAKYNMENEVSWWCYSFFVLSFHSAIPIYYLLDRSPKAQESPRLKGPKGPKSPPRDPMAPPQRRLGLHLNEHKYQYQ